MAFPTDWGRRCELIIQASKIDSALVYFPVLLQLVNLPSEMFDADGSYPALEGGGDIRFSTDEAGSNQIACEIVSFHIDNNPALGYAEIWVEVPSISSSSPTSIWVWYNKTGESQPSESSTYGKHDVWDDGGNNYHKAVHHMKDLTSSTVEDSTQYSNDGTKRASNNPLQTSGGQVREDQQFVVANDDYLVAPDSASLDITTYITMEAWIYMTAAPIKYTKVVAKNKAPTYYPYQMNFNEIENMQLVFQLGDIPNQVESQLAIPQNEWVHVMGTYDGTTMRFYVNGVEDAFLVVSVTIDTNDLSYCIGGRDTDFYYTFPGRIDEVRLANTARSAGWVKACWYNTDDPATFILEQTPSSPSAYKLEGITKDKNGDVLGSCPCYLFKDNQDNTLTYVGYVLSNAVTGAYSFTGIGDSDAQYIVVAWKDGSPNVFDVTDHVLQPVAE